MRENAYAESRMVVRVELGLKRSGASAGMCSVTINSDISGEHDSTAAENVWRRHTQATVGSPDRFVNGRRKTRYPQLTIKDVLMDAGQVHIGFVRACHDEAIDDTL
jgi:hypothetical protein